MFLKKIFYITKINYKQKDKVVLNELDIDENKY